MRVAYLILAHKLPQQLARLVNHLRQAGGAVYVHFDSKSTTPTTYVDGLRDVEVIPERVKVWWGGWSTVRAELALAGAALPGNFDYYCLLSGQCYPLRPLREFHEYLQSTHPIEHMVYVDVKSNWPEAAIRYEKHYFEQRTLLGRALTKLVRKFPYSRSLPSGLKPHVGWTWWTLTHNSLAYLLSTLESRRDVARFFAWSQNADEIAPQTIIASSHFAERVSTSPLHMIEFAPREPNPRIWLTQDLPRLLSSKAYFARKFDIQVDATVLDELDKSVSL